MAGSKWTDQSGVIPAESDSDNPPMERETGITEKMLNSYGFIRCCDRQARLFFHFSQYEGLIEHLKPGDPVDFEMSFDKKSGKPIAVRVQKICSDTSINVGGGQSLVNGVVTLELNSDGKGGRVAYENCGECFFFEFSRKDLVDPIHDNPRQGQPVQFVITQDAAGNLQVGEVQSVATQPQALQPVKQQQQYITTSLVYPNMMVPMMPEIMSPQVIAYTPAPALQMAPIVNGVGPLAAANGRMLHTGMNGNGKDVELLAAHPQAQRAVYKVNLNNSIVQQTTNIQHYSGQSTKNNTVPHQQQQLAHPAAGGSGSLNQTNGASPNNHQSPMQSKGQNNKNIKNNSLRAGDDIDQQQQQQDNDNNIRYQGVVCTMKDNYGFVERDDVVKEIFFHCSEGYQGIALGDDVSFNITTRNNRTVAVNLERLDPGTVVFSDLDEQPRKGTVLKLYSQTEEPLNGRILCEENGEKKQYGFGDRDLAPASWTMKSGDPVFFHVATDRRDGAQHATNITMNIGAAGAFTKETRLTGTVVTIKENYGFVLTEQDNQKYYFKLSDVLDSELRHESTVQFSLGSEHQNGGPAAATTTTASNNGSRQIAIRICKAPSPTKKKSSRKTITTMKCTHKGFISALKDHFGFIESENHQEDLFFHYTNVDGDVKDLQIGSEVEYSLVSKKDRPSAEVVRLLEKGTIPPMEPVSDEIFTGKVIRALRCHNPDQTPYCGLLEIGTGVENSSTAAGEAKESEEDAESSSGGHSSSGSDSQEEDQVNANAESGKEYKFSVLSLAKPGEVMQKGDLVEFQLANCKISDTIFAVNVKSVRKTAVIELMKGAVAYLNYELEGGRKLSFNTSEVTRKPNTDFAAGDLVEFDLARNGRHQKLVATNVKRIREKEASPRPAALVNRIKSMAISDEGPKVVAIRQPRGPDGSKGFAALVSATA